MTKKCPNSIKGMISALKKKYPEKHSKVAKCFRVYEHTDNIDIEYDIYIADITCETSLTWNNLKNKVQYCLNKET